VWEADGELYVDEMDGVSGSPWGLFARVEPSALAGAATSASGLVLPGIPSTAWMLGLAPIVGGTGGWTTW
jgi:hypothetical protein